MGTLLHILNNLQVQFTDAKGNLCQKNVPIVFASREKSVMLEDFTEKQLLSTNLNVIPRGFLKFTTMNRNDGRIMNKNIKINTFKHDDTMNFQYNCMPYDFTFDCMIKCRGMTEACMLMEQIAVWFNPNLNVEIYDADYEDAPTDITIKLLDLNPQINDYDETSQHIIEVMASFSVSGWIYTPVRSQSRIKEFIMRVHPEDSDDHFSLGYDVESGKLIRENYVDKAKASTELKVESVNVLSPESKNVYVDFVKKGVNKVDIKVSTPKHVQTVLSVEVIESDAVWNSDDQTLTVSSEDDVCLKVELRDEFNNNYTLYKYLKYHD